MAVYLMPMKGLDDDDDDQISEVAASFPRKQRALLDEGPVVSWVQRERG